MKRRARSSETLRPLPVRITKAEAFNGTGLALLPLAARIGGRTHHSETLNQFIRRGRDLTGLHDPHGLFRVFRKSLETLLAIADVPL